MFKHSKIYGCTYTIYDKGYISGFLFENDFLPKTIWLIFSNSVI